MEFKKTLLQNLTEYRTWAWDIAKIREGDHIDNTLGLLPIYEWYDIIKNEDGEWVDIDEEGNVIPEDTAENVKLEDWVYGLEFPVIAVHCFDEEWDRLGDIEFCFCEFVSKNEFEVQK
jgi:hypothetical protein